MLVEYNSAYKDVYEDFRLQIEGSFDRKLRDPFDYYLDKNLCENRLWLLFEGKKVVGSVFTKLQKYKINGDLKNIYFIKYPVTLAVIDKNYTHSSIKLIIEIRKLFPESFLLGMGGIQSNTAKIFSKFGFKIIDIPFLVKIINIHSLILKNPYSIKIFRIKFFFKMINSLSSVLKNPYFSILDLVHQIPKGYSVEEVNNFDDEYFKFRDENFSFGLLRNANILNSQTPNLLPCFKKIVVKLNGSNSAFFTLFISNCNGHKYFGNLKISVLLDWFIVDSSKSDKYLFKSVNWYVNKLNVDLLLANTGYNQHVSQLKKVGWHQLRSNFAIAFSPYLARVIKPESLFITRLDGDGPINMGVDL